MRPLQCADVIKTTICYLVAHIGTLHLNRYINVSNQYIE